MAGSALAETKSLHVPAAYGEPPDGWTWSRLDDVSEGVFDCPHSTPKLTDTGPFVVRTQDIITGVFRADQAGCISEETYAERIARVTPSRGDLLYSREGTYFGIAAEVPPRTRVCLGQRMVLIRPDKRRLDFSFLCHWLNSPIMAAHIHGYRDGTVAERLNLPTIRALPILIPPLAEQQAIAAVLGALDDKIELNRRMNATLEAMARALFQSWFVDFDPVRAKLDGRPPDALDPATAAHFPDSFVETTAGHIPHGWRVGSIYEVANVIYGAPFASSLFNSEKLGKPLIRIRDLPNESPAIFTTEVHPKGYLLQPGNITVGMDGEFRAYLWAGVESWLNQRVCVFAPKPGYSAAFVRNSIIAPLAQVEATETATTVIHLGKNDIDRFTVIIPDAPVAEAFKRECQPWYDQIVANKQQSRTLATLRDTLLPKLLSGSMKINNQTD
ncbi:MAG: restriction endonuclease subunit S [Chromatiaceae bacterium]